MNDSILGDGCVVRAGCTINHSVIGLRSLIGAGTTIEDALIMGCGTSWRLVASNAPVYPFTPRKRPYTRFLHYAAPSLGQLCKALRLQSSSVICSKSEHSCPRPATGFVKHGALLRAATSPVSHATVHQVSWCRACRSDYFETLEECALVPGCLPMGIGDNCTIRHCIVDKNARIGSDVQIVNKEGVQESNREDDGYVIKARAWTSSPHCPVSSSDDMQPQI